MYLLFLFSCFFSCALFAQDIPQEKIDHVINTLEQQIVRSKAAIEAYTKENPHMHFPYLIHCKAHSGPYILEIQEIQPGTMDRVFQLERQVETYAISHAYYYINDLMNKGLSLRCLNIDEFCDLLKNVHKKLAGALIPLRQGVFRTKPILIAPRCVAAERGFSSVEEERIYYLYQLSQHNFREKAHVTSYLNKYLQLKRQGKPISAECFSKEENWSAQRNVPLKSALNIEQRLQNGLKEAQMIDDPYKFACALHHLIVDIHPFDDCNGRLGRALTNWALVEQGKDPEFFLNEAHYKIAAIIDINNGTNCHLRNTMRPSSTNID